MARSAQNIQSKLKDQIVTYLMGFTPRHDDVIKWKQFPRY